MQKLVIFDLDDTLFDGQSQKIFLQLIRKAGLVSLVDYLKLLSWFVLYKLHLVKDTDKIRDFGYQILAGISSEKISDVLKEYFDLFQMRILFPGKQRVSEHLSAGARVVIISASNNFVVSRLAASLGVAEYICTELDEKNGILTGGISGNAVYGEEKLKRVKRLLRNFKASSVEFYTDHISDLSLLEFADVRNCVNPDPELKRVAQSKKWNIFNWK